jgi:glycine/D-amino acid oxidase-like deaminating enzyme
VRHNYDVAIVGGAVIGSAVAYFLSANPDFKGSVLVVEKDPTYARASTSLSFLVDPRHESRGHLSFLGPLLCLVSPESRLDRK